MPDPIAADSFTVEGTRYAMRLVEINHSAIGPIPTVEIRRFGSTALVGSEQIAVYRGNATGEPATETSVSARSGFWTEPLVPNVEIAANESLTVVYSAEYGGQTFEASVSVPSLTNDAVTWPGSLSTDGVVWSESEPIAESDLRGITGRLTNTNDSQSSSGLSTQSSSTDTSDTDPSGATLAFVGLAAIAVIYYTQT